MTSHLLCHLGTSMTSHQLEIFRSAPRYLRFFSQEVDQLEYPHLIPDTSKARQRALEMGASHFDSLSFLHPHSAWMPPSHLFGDFHCRLLRSPFSTETITKTVTTFIPGIFTRLMDTWSTLPILITYIDDESIEIMVPSTFFGMQDGSLLLQKFYLAFASLLQKSLYNYNKKKEKHPVVAYCERVDTKKQSGRFAIPLAWEEFITLSSPYSLELARCRHTTTVTSYSERMSGNIRRNLIEKAINLFGQRPPEAPIKNPPVWPGLSPLTDERGLSVCEGASIPGVKCALKLLSWCREAGISEFRRRNALRAVDGVFTLHHGVEEALNILSKHGHIREIPFPQYDYPGRRPSPWYVVNPAIFRNHT